MPPMPCQPPGGWQPWPWWQGLHLAPLDHLLSLSLALGRHRYGDRDPGACLEPENMVVSERERENEMEGQMFSHFWGMCWVFWGFVLDFIALNDNVMLLTEVKSYGRARLVRWSLLSVTWAQGQVGLDEFVAQVQKIRKWSHSPK